MMVVSTRLTPHTTKKQDDKGGYLEKGFIAHETHGQVQVADVVAGLRQAVHRGVADHGRLGKHH
jgi:hypothetical protein